MATYVLNRILIAIPTIIGITMLIFFAMRILPGDPLATVTDATTGTQQRLTDEEITKLRDSLGLNDPYYVQYGRWMKDVLRGDFGSSFWRGEPIRELFLRRGPISLQIALMAVAFSWVVGVPLGILSATHRNGFLDVISRGLTTLFQAVPSFWIGLVIVLVGVLVFTWRPPLSIVYFQDDPVRNLQMTLGPAFALGLGIAAGTARMTRSAILEALYHDYARTARAKGLRERAVVYRHVLRNALLPVVTLSGLAFGGLLGGSVATERAFGFPGLGLALVQAIGERDWMIIQNLVLLYAVIYTVMNLLVDISYSWLDPTDQVPLMADATAAVEARSLAHGEELDLAPEVGAVEQLRRFTRQSPAGAVAAGLILLVLVVGTFAPVLAPYDPLLNSFSEVRQPPSPTHWLGTDHLGRDVLSRIIYGTRITMLVAITSVLIGESLGFAWGVACGYIGGRFDLVSQRLVEVMMSFPGLILAILLLVALGPGLSTVIIAIGVTRVPGTTRIVRSVALALRELAYVEAARALGTPSWRIMVRHIAPQCIAPMLVLISLNLGGAIFTEAGLSFLGAGIPPPNPSWGNMLGGVLAEAFRPSWWLVVFPGLAITLTVMAFNLLGDALRDFLDPRLRGVLE